MKTFDLEKFIRDFEDPYYYRMAYKYQDEIEDPGLIIYSQDYIFQYEFEQIKIPLKLVIDIKRYQDDFLSITHDKDGNLIY